MNTTIDSGPNSSVSNAKGGLKECGRGHHDSGFAGGEPKDVEDCAAAEREGRGLIGCEIPRHSFQSPQSNAERADSGAGGGNSSPPHEGEKRANAEDDESLSSLWTEERGVNVAIVVEGRPEGARLEENSSVGNSRPRNITNSPREQSVDRKQEASSQRKDAEEEEDGLGDEATSKSLKEAEEEDDSSRDEGMMKSLKGFRKRHGSYLARIAYQGRTCSVGTYELRADAALAHDEISKVLRGPACRLNFSGESEHIRMREKEMKSNGLRVDLEETLAVILAEVERVVSSVGGPAKPVERCNLTKCSERTPVGAQPENNDATFKSLKGIHRSSTRRSYQSMISHRGKRLYLGSYELQSDAAFAYDLAKRSLEGQKWSEANFRTKKDHVDVRDEEMRSTGLDVDLKRTLDRISMNVKEAVSKIRAASAQDGDSCISDDDGSDEECSLPGAGLKNDNVTFNFKSLKGVNRSSTRRSYQSQINIQGRRYYLGRYDLQSDAAFAYDSVGRALEGPKWRKANFRTAKDHVDMRDEEMRLTGLTVDLKRTLARISMNVKEAVSKIRAASAQDGDSCISDDDGSDEMCFSAGAELENNDIKFASLKGVNRRSTGRTYQSNMYHRGKNHYVGSYQLQCDAALAYDLAKRALEGPKWSKANFRTKKDHVNMRDEEMRSTGLAVDLNTTLARISMNVKEAVSKIRAGSGQDGDSCVGDYDGSSGSDNHDHLVGVMEAPTTEVLHWVRRMPIHVQRRHIAAGSRVKVRFEDDVWYGGVVKGVMYGGRRGRRIKIRFDDGTEEMTDFPDDDVIVDDVGNGGHRGDASAFIPPVDASLDQICNRRDGSRSSVTEELVATKSNANSIGSNICSLDEDTSIGRSSEGSLSTSHADSEKTKAVIFEKKDTSVLSRDQTRRAKNAAISIGGKRGELNEETGRPTATSSACNEAAVEGIAASDGGQRVLAGVSRRPAAIVLDRGARLAIEGWMSRLLSEEERQSTAKRACPRIRKRGSTADCRKISRTREGEEAEAPPPAPLEEQVRELTSYREAHGHFPTSACPNVRLVRLCSGLRRARRYPGKAGPFKLSAAIIADLDARGFEWNPNNGRRKPPKTLRERIQELRAYREKHGPGLSHSGINGEKVSNEELLRFRADLRRSRRRPHRAKYKLSEEDIAELDSFGFDWNLSGGVKRPNMSTDQSTAHQQAKEQAPSPSYLQEPQEDKEQNAAHEAQAHSIHADVPWFYQDLHGISQGPFSTDQMRYWFQSGYLKDELGISQSRGGPFRSLSSYFSDLSKAFLTCPDLMRAPKLCMGGVASA